MRGGRKIKSYVFNFIKTINIVLVLNIVLFGILLSVGTYYLIQINNLAITGYSIRDYEREISSLEEEIHSLELKIAQKQSIYEIKKKVDNLNLLSINNYQYFTAKNMAKK